MSGKARSILDLNIEELEEILKSNELPPDVGLEGIQNRDDFNKLFKHRLNPKLIAQHLLRDKMKTRVLVESPELKDERLQVKKAELEIRKLRAENQTAMQQNIYKRLQAIEDGLSLVVAGMSNLNQRLTQLLEGQNPHN